MVTDFLWRQFLWFCFRNVLWYGESGGIHESFSCNDNIEIVNSYNILKDNNKANTNDTVALPSALLNSGVNNNDVKDSNIVVMSTLERTLRQCPI